MPSRFTLRQKIAFVGLLIVFAAIALAAHFAPSGAKGVEVSEPICPVVCPPPH